tara:strand:- start:216 stop:452 length:237 start_codon:yes stop_codon:yes gene_type:complete
MDGLWVCNKILKTIQERENRIHAVLVNNELADMAQYRAFMGEITALGSISQEISEMLERGAEHDDQGTILTGSFNQKT